MIETLHTLNGFDVVVKNQVGATTVSDGAETGTKTGEITVSKDGTQNVAYENDYKKLEERGNIKITKTIKGDVTDEDLKGLTFSIYDSSDNLIRSVKLSEFDRPDGLTGTKGTYEYTLENVNATKTYYVVETLHTLNGFDVVVKNQIGATSVSDGAATGPRTGEITVSKDGTQNVAYENDYKKLEERGNIKITKTIKGDVTDEDLKGLTFSIYDSSDNLIKSVKLSEFDRPDGLTGTKGTYEYTLENVDATKTYYVVETLHTLKGFTVTVKNKVGASSVSSDAVAGNQTANFSVPANGTQNIAYENDYSQKTVDVKFSKQDMGGTEIAGAKISLWKGTELTDSNFVTSWTSTNAVHTVTGLVPGTYTFKETVAPDGYKLVETAITFEVDAEANVTVTTVSENVGMKEDNTIVLKNAPKTGYLSIAKTFGGPVVEADKQFLTFTVVKEGTNEKVGTFTLYDFDYDADNDIYTLKEEKKLLLPLGTYVVTESNYDVVSGKDITVTYKVGNKAGTGNSAKVTLINADATEVIAFNNEYPAAPEVKKGYLSIAKTFGGPVVEEDKENLVFTVTKAGTNEQVAVFKLSDFDYDAMDDIYTLKADKKLLLPLDTYVVTESNYDLATGKTVTVSYKVGNKADNGDSAVVTLINENAEEVVTFHNQYSENPVEKTGKLIIYKAFGGPVVADDLKYLSFNIKNKETGNLITTLTLKDHFMKITDDYYVLKEAYALPEGDYLVEECNYNVVSKQKVSVTYQYQNEWMNGSSASVIIDVVEGSEEPAVISFKNTYPEKVEPVEPVEPVVPVEPVEPVIPVIPKAGTLVITKTFGGPVVEADKKTLSFEVKFENSGKTRTYKLSDFTESGGVYTKTIAVEEEDLGNVTITEKNYNEESGASVEVSYKINGGSKKVSESAGARVEDGKTVTVAFNNEYPEEETEETGKISVHVIEEKSGMDVPEAKVVITDESGKTRTYITNKDGVIVDENGEIPVVPAGEYTITISEVPVGYEVTTGEVGTVTVPKDGEGHHDAVISTEKGAIIITVLDEETEEPVPDADVLIVTSDGDSGIFTTDENGQVTRYAEVDEFGNYTAEPGTYEYSVVKVPEGYHVTVGEEQTGEVYVGELTELEAKIAMSTGGLDIKVIDEKTKEPVQNATVEIIYPDGSTHTFITDKDGMITELTKKDENGHYLAKTGLYKITVIRVPEGYTVSTGQTKEEIVEEDQVKHHVAEIITTDSSTRRPPQDKTAQTGDETPITMLFILMMISAAGFAGVVVKKKRARK